MQIKKAKLMTHQKSLKHVNRRESVNDNVKKNGRRNFKSIRT